MTKLKYFTFEIGCDHLPDFKTEYELIFKSNVVYANEQGIGHSYTSVITGGMAGDGHNNVVTISPD